MGEVVSTPLVMLVMQTGLIVHPTNLSMKYPLESAVATKLLLFRGVVEVGGVWTPVSWSLMVEGIRSEELSWKFTVILLLTRLLMQVTDELK